MEKYRVVYKFNANESYYGDEEFDTHKEAFEFLKVQGFKPNGNSYINQLKERVIIETFQAAE